MTQKLTTKLQSQSHINMDIDTFSKANICFRNEVKTKVFMPNKGSIHQLSNYGNEADVTMWNNRPVRSTMLIKS